MRREIGIEHIGQYIFGHLSNREIIAEYIPVNGSFGNDFSGTKRGCFVFYPVCVFYESEFKLLANPPPTLLRPTAQASFWLTLLYASFWHIPFLH